MANINTSKNIKRVLEYPVNDVCLNEDKKIKHELIEITTYADLAEGIEKYLCSSCNSIIIKKGD